MKPSEAIWELVRLYRIRFPEDYDASKAWIIATMSYLDEQHAITNSTTTMKKKVNKLKKAVTASAKKAVKKASKSKKK